MATLSSILAWTIAWTEEPGWLLIPGVTKELDTTEHARTGSRSRASRIVARGLSGCGAQALAAAQHVESSRTGLEPMSSTLAGRFLTTGPPGKSKKTKF